MAERNENSGATERPSLLKRLAGNAQSLAAILAVAVSAVNVWFIFIDRERQARREVYQQQIEMTKFYFERVANLKPEDWCDQAPLFAQASAIMAGMEPQALRLRNVAASAAAQRRAVVGATAELAAAPGMIDREHGVEALAATIVAAIDARAGSSRDCDGRVEVAQDGTPRAKSGGAFTANSYAVQAAIASVAPSPAGPSGLSPVAAPEPTPAQAQAQAQAEAQAQQRAQAEARRPAAAGAAPPPPPVPVPPPAGPRMTVYIQYPDGAEARARALRERITRELAAGYTAPGSEKVRQAPARDQIRIYRDADQARASALADALGMADAQIVNLSRSYRNLPANTLEVWLKAP